MYVTCGRCGAQADEQLRAPLCAPCYRDAHRDQAGPDDHLPPEPRYRIDPATMAAVPVGAAAEREREQAQRQREWDERKAAERRAEAATRERVVAERRAAAPIPPGFG